MSIKLGTEERPHLWRGQVWEDNVQQGRMIYISMRWWPNNDHSVTLVLSYLS
jgi:hypothetical protein